MKKITSARLISAMLGSGAVLAVTLVAAPPAVAFGHIAVDAPPAVAFGHIAVDAPPPTTSGHIAVD